VYSAADEDRRRRNFALDAKIAARNGLKNCRWVRAGDFAEASRLRRYHVRVGSAIFGHTPARCGR